MTRKKNLEALESKLGYVFRDRSLLRLALTHKSCSRSTAENNERLEFLGDAVLQLVVSDHLFSTCQGLREGQLAKIRSLLVSQPTQAEQARKLGINHCLRVGRGEQQTGAQNRDSLLCDTLEAIFGAVYLDSDIDTARPIILGLLPSWDEQEISHIDAKSTLQEHLQQLSQETPVYELAGEVGPDHDKMFEVNVCFQGEVLGRGRGRSKKEAAQEAARRALDYVDVAVYPPEKPSSQQ